MKFCNCGKIVKKILSAHEYMHIHPTPRIIFHIHTYTSHVPHMHAQHNFCVILLNYECSFNLTSVHS